MKRNIPISLPCTGEEEWLAVKEPLTTGWLTQGPKVAEFEKMFAARHQVQHAIASTSATTALHLILAAMGIGPGDEVIVPAFTWVATANVVLYCGAKPVFVDVDPITNNIDVKKVAARITSKTKAIIAVHLFGLCADIDALKKIAGNIPVVEDAACATGASYKGRSAGSLGIAAGFSFHPRKAVTTGEGGMVTTNDAKLAETVNCLRNHGASVSEEQRHHGPKPYILAEFNLLGFNYRLTDIQASVGIAQLKKLDRFLDERSAAAKFYFSELKSVPWLKLPVIPDGYGHAWQSFVCQVDPDTAPFSRNEIMEKLLELGISTRPGTHAVHMLGYYRERYGIKPEDYPGAQFCDQQTMAIPLHNRMSREDYQYVVDSLKSL